MSHGRASAGLDPRAAASVGVAPILETSAGRDGQELKGDGGERVSEGTSNSTLATGAPAVLETGRFDEKPRPAAPAFSASHTAASTKPATPSAFYAVDFRFNVASSSSLAAVNALTAIAATSAVNNAPQIPIRIASSRVSSALGARSP